MHGLPRPLQKIVLVSAVTALTLLFGDIAASAASVIRFKVDGWKYDGPNAINSSGMITGLLQLSTDKKHERGNFIGFIRAPDGEITTFGTLIQPLAINDSGVIAGTYFEEDGGFVRDTDGTITLFGLPPPFQFVLVSGINSAGEVVGSYYSDTDGSTYTYVRSLDGKLDTFSVFKARYTFGTAINDNDQVAGYYADRDGANHGFVRSAKGKAITFDVSGAWDGIYPANINALGVISGTYRDYSLVWHGFVRSADGTITKFDAPDALQGQSQGTTSTGLNNNGDIIGYYDGYHDGQLGRHGFVRSADGTITEFDAGDLGSTLTEPTAINDSGDITGNYTYGPPLNPNHRIGGFLRVP